MAKFMVAAAGSAILVLGSSARADCTSAPQLGVARSRRPYGGGVHPRQRQRRGHCICLRRGAAPFTRPRRPVNSPCTMLSKSIPANHTRKAILEVISAQTYGSGAKAASAEAGQKFPSPPISSPPQRRLGPTRPRHEWIIEQMDLQTAGAGISFRPRETVCLATRFWPKT